MSHFWQICDGNICPSNFVHFFTTQKWNFQIWIKIEQKICFYFSKLLNSLIQWPDTWCIGESPIWWRRLFSEVSTHENDIVQVKFTGELKPGLQEARAGRGRCLGDWPGSSKLPSGIPQPQSVLSVLSHWITWQSWKFNSLFWLEGVW